MRHWWALGVMMLACLLGGPARARPPALVWKAELGSRLYSAPLVCELLPSPGQEVVVCAAEARQVVALSAQGKVLWRYGEGFSARLTPSPAAGDLDGDGQPEIVVAGGGSPALLLCLDRAGARRWERRLEGEMDWSAPVIADLEGDGAPEIVVGTTSGQVCCYDGRGERRWQTKLEAGISSLLAVADVDGEGKAEVLVPCGRWLYCLDQAGQVKWRFEAPVACNGASVGDLEGDGRPDIVLACDEQTVYRLDAAGRMVWAYHGGYAGGGDGWMAAPALAEAGQGRLEIILGDGNGTLRGLDDRGRERWCYQFGRPIGDPPTAGDVDGDGRLEVLAGFDDDGTVLCLEERPAVDWQFRAGFRVVSSPTLADLEGDGRVEVLVTSNDHALYCLRPVGRRGGRLPWPRRAHDNQQTGAWQGGRP